MNLRDKKEKAPFLKNQNKKEIKRNEGDALGTTGRALFVTLLWNIKDCPHRSRKKDRLLPVLGGFFVVQLLLGFRFGLGHHLLYQGHEARERLRRFGHH